MTRTLRLSRRGTIAGRGAAAGGVGVTDYVKLRRTSNQNFSSAPIAIVFNSEDSDTSNYWTSGLPSRVTVPTGKAGDHLMTLLWTMNASGDRGFGDLQVFNSSDVNLRTFRSPVGFNGEDTGHNTVMTRLNDGDYINIVVYTSTGGTHDITAARFEMVRIA